MFGGVIKVEVRRLFLLLCLSLFQARVSCRALSHAAPLTGQTERGERLVSPQLCFPVAHRKLQPLAPPCLDRQPHLHTRSLPSSIATLINSQCVVRGDNISTMVRGKGLQSAGCDSSLLHTDAFSPPRVCVRV